MYGPEAAVAFTTFGFEAPAQHLGVREIEVGGAAVLVIRGRRVAGVGPIGLSYVASEVTNSKVVPELTWSDAGRQGTAVLYGPPLQPFWARAV